MQKIHLEKFNTHSTIRKTGREGNFCNLIKSIYRKSATRTLKGVMWMNLHIIMLVKELISKDYIIYYSIYLTFWKCHVYGNRKQIRSFLGLRKVWG